jgi:hypothetical protein
MELVLAPILGKLYATTGELPGQADSKLDGKELEGVDATDAPDISFLAPLTTLGPPYDNASAPKIGVTGPPPATKTRE